MSTLLIFGAFLLSDGTKPGPVDAEWRTRLASTGYQVASQYAELSRHLEEHSVEEYSRKDDTGVFQPARNIRNCFSSLGPCWSVEIQRTNIGQPDSAESNMDVRNPDYVFTLRGKGDAPKYALIKLGEATPAADHSGYGLHRTLVEAIQASAGAARGGDGFALKSLQWSEKENLLSVRFSTHWNQNVLVQDQEVFLEPDQGWRVRRLRKETPTLLLTAELTYGTTIDDLFFPSEVVIGGHYKIANGPPDFRTKGRIVDLHKNRKNPADYYLTAFGFPEPVGTTPPSKPIPRFMWLACAALACAALATTVRYLSRRYSGRLARNGQAT